MQRIALVVSLVLASAAFAQAVQKPDYSREALRKSLVVINEDHPPVPQTVRWGFGSVEFRAFGMNWRVAFLPFAMPFSGSVRGSNPSTMWPDPFALTGTQFAETPRTWRDNREVSKERKRIESMAKVTAK